MLFFEINGDIKDNDWKEIYNNREEFNGAKEKIEGTIREFNKARDDFYFVSSISAIRIRIGVIANNGDGIRKRTISFLENIHIAAENITIEETTLKNANTMLLNADRKSFIYDKYEIVEQFNLCELNHHFGGNPFNEMMVSPIDKNKTYSWAKECMCDDTLIPELDRIYERVVELKKAAHPVHYMIQTSDVLLQKDLVNVLISALYNNKRVLSKRCSIAQVSNNGESISRKNCLQMYENAEGGTVIMCIDLEDSGESNLATGDYEAIECLCRDIMKYRNKVLTILCFSNKCNRVKSMIYENFHNMSFVEIEEDLSDDEKSIDYLKSRAKEYSIRSDKKLTEKIEPGEKYYTKELNEIFDEWYQLKIKNTVFPQYKEITTIKKTDNKKKKGLAYDELAKMIGLTEVKKIIDKALDYYRAQKMFAEKGMKKSNPAMHMVFTGNPGTAKTSVARLFAKILRDNKVLSNGHMIEVGRGDLVGKYVGWTAKIVQKKFREAKGGVLFIDEAYSLVEDKFGGYGDEAINTIVQEMENHREDVVVVFAGYPKEMEMFLDKNPGLRSRIAFHVPFDDYTPDELCDIAKLMAEKEELILTDDSIDKMHKIFETACECDDFGNGRFVRNLLEDARMAQASRLVDMDYDSVKKSDIRTIKDCDIEMPASYRDKEKEEQRVIGFAS
ncbi:MAG: AAA family ATPase [Eubacterium sp.]|nr:AAA family ATPase [Eubacterium sp.]